MHAHVPPCIVITREGALASPGHEYSPLDQVLDLQRSLVEFGILICLQMPFTGWLVFLPGAAAESLTQT